MKKLVNDIVNKLSLHNITFGDVRYTNTDTQSIFFEKGILKHFNTSKDSTCIGIRVLKNGCWGFAGTNILTDSSVEKTIKKAVINAEHASKFRKNKVFYQKQNSTIATYIQNPREDPFLMPDEEKINILSQTADLLTKNEKIVYSMLYNVYYRQYKIYANTEGTFVDTLLYNTLPLMKVLASKGEKVMSRTFPGHMSGEMGGFEVFRNGNFNENADKIIKEAIDLLEAPDIEDHKADIIIGGGHLALQLHESIGHATEADRIFGMEISYAGKTFIKPEMIGSLKYGSNILNVYSDSTNPAGMGFHLVDDDGVPGKRVDVIKDGVLVNQQTSREIAPLLGLEPSSNMKSSFADDFPLIRMTNLCIAPVNGSLEQLIEDTENGYFIDYTKTWSIDDNRNNFQFTTEIGWKIKDGRIVGIVKEPTYYGITTEFWNACDRICGPGEWKFHGTFHCGKGEPGQALHLSHGVSPARFRNIVVNVKA